jgi:beta-N-acetylhexosaminidase
MPDPRPSRPGTLVRRVLLVTGCAAVLAGCTGTSSSQVEVRAEPEPVDATTTTTPPDCAEQLPPAAQAGQLLMTMVTSPTLATEVVASGQVTGFGLKGRQASDVDEEVAAAVADAPVTPLIASDEEGGTVQRLDQALESLPSAAEMAEGTPSEAGALFADYAASMRELGFNMSFGPVADVGSGSDLGTRSFGDDAETVATFTDAIISAQEDAGIASVVKHWPGIGGGDSDPHVQLDSLAPIEELRADDLVPFDRAIAAGASGIMVAHAVVPGLTAEGEPASLSRAAITDELRGRQGFDGLVVTDSLGMGAVVNTVAQDEAALRSIQAGADVALLSGTDVVAGAHALVTDAIATGVIPIEQVLASVRRVLAAKGIEGPCTDLVATYSSLMQDTTATDGASGSDGTTDADGTNDADGTTGSSDGADASTGAGAVTDSGINDTGTDDTTG